MRRVENHWRNFLCEVTLLHEVLDKLNPILDELSVEQRESRMSKETESSESTQLLEVSKRLIQITQTHSPSEIYANIEIRFEKIRGLLRSMEVLKINFKDENLVRMTRSTLTSCSVSPS